MTDQSNSIAGAALCLGVDPKDLAEILPALRAAKEFRSNGVGVRINPTESWEPIPRLNPEVRLVTIDLQLTTYQEARLNKSGSFRDETLNALANAFFGPKSPPKSKPL